MHVVLFEPQIPPNTGNIIRLCANAGVTLHLVKPLGFKLDDKSLRRSGLDYHDLADLHVHESFEACAAAVSGSRLFAVETGALQCYSDVRYRDGDAFLFGSETRGVPANIMSCIGAEHSVFIPMQPGNRSINLSNAVALIVYEAWRQLGFTKRTE